MAVLSPPLAEFFDMFFQFFLDYIMFAHNHPGKDNVKVNQQQQQTVDRVWCLLLPCLHLYVLDSYFQYF